MNSAASDYPEPKLPDAARATNVRFQISFRFSKHGFSAIKALRAAAEVNGAIRLRVSQKSVDTAQTKVPLI